MQTEYFRVKIVKAIAFPSTDVTTAYATTRDGRDVVTRAEAEQMATDYELDGWNTTIEPYTDFIKPQPANK